MENNFTIYCHISPSNKMYIGITSSKPKYRWHRGYDHNPHFQSAINKYGWDSFQHTILAEHLSKDWACKLEQILIRDLKLQDPQFGYNMSSGGDCSSFGCHRPGRKHPEETKRKMSETRRGKSLSAEHREKIRQAKLNMSDETKKKISQSKLGNKAGLGHTVTPEHREKLRQANLGNKHSLGVRRSEETKRKISEKAKQRYQQKQLGQRSAQNNQFLL